MVSFMLAGSFGQGLSRRKAVHPDEGRNTIALISTLAALHLVR